MTSYQSGRSGSTSSLSCTGVFASLLAVAFIVLKLTGYIDWPWVWVLSPIWIGIAFSIVLFLIALAIILYLDK